MTPALASGTTRWWRPSARALSAVHVWPITAEIAKSSTRLDIRGEPADELIAATSLVHNVRLVTRDSKLLASRIVPLA